MVLHKQNKMKDGNWEHAWLPPLGNSTACDVQQLHLTMFEGKSCYWKCSTCLWFRENGDKIQGGNSIRTTHQFSKLVEAVENVEKRTFAALVQVGWLKQWRLGHTIGPDCRHETLNVGKGNETGWCLSSVNHSRRTSRFQQTIHQSKRRETEDIRTLHTEDEPPAEAMNPDNYANVIGAETRRTRAPINQPRWLAFLRSHDNFYKQKSWTRWIRSSAIQAVSFSRCSCFVCYVPINSQFVEIVRTSANRRRRHVVSSASRFVTNKFNCTR